MVRKLKMGMDDNRMALKDIFSILKEIINKLIDVDTDIEDLKTLKQRVEILEDDLKNNRSFLKIKLRQTLKQQTNQGRGV